MNPEEYVEQSTEVVNTEVKYNRNDKDKIISEVCSLFDQLNDDRKEQIDTIRVVEDMLKVKSSSRGKSSSSFDEDDEVAPYLKDSAISRILDTAVSQSYNSTFKKPTNLFNVNITDEDIIPENNHDPITAVSPVNDTPEQDFKNQALLQKEYILSAIKKANAKAEFRKGMLNLYKKGEFILRVTWAQEFEVVSKKEQYTNTEDGMNINLEKKVTVKQLKYDGVKIKCIEPENFVYDTSYDSFNLAPKISRVYTPLSVIKNNDLYKEFLKKDDYRELSDIVKSGKVDNSDLDEDYYYDNTKGLKGKQVEVLEYEGDITIDGEFYPNMKIVVIARKYIGCFMYNPQLCSSYLYSAYDVDQDNGRGIGLIARLIPTSKATTDTLRKLNRALGLSINKCFLAPSGAFSDDLEIAENAIIEYDKNKLDGNDLKPLDFQSALNICMGYLQYLKGEQEEATNRYKYNSGDSPKESRTLGETRLVIEAQNTLQSFELDRVYDEIIIPLAEKIGQMLANFKDGVERIKYTNDKGENAIGVVDDYVRTANYSYEINDPENSATNKMNKLEFMQALISQLGAYMAQTGQGVLSAKEILNVIASGYDIPNPDKFILQQETMPQEEEPQQMAEMPLQEELPPNVDMPDLSGVQAEGEPPALDVQAILGNVGAANG